MKIPHRPALILVIVLSLGILIGHFLPFPLMNWLWVALISIAVFSFTGWLWPIHIGLFALGAALVHIAHPPAMDILYDWRMQLEQSLYHYLDANEAGTVSAIVLGDHAHIPKEIKMIFRHTGTGHILVIAGLHMAIMSSMIILVLKLIRIPRPAQIVLSIFLLLGYAMLTGGSVPVLRAACMACIWLASFTVELESDALNSLSLAALWILLMGASNLFDTSFQLSFAAVAAIILLYRPLEKLFSSLPRWVSAALSVSTAAWIGIVPFQLWHFGTFTPVALIANLVVVPLLDIIVILGLNLALTGLWLPPVAVCIAGCLKVVLNTTIIAAFWFSKLPWGYFQT